MNDKTVILHIRREFNPGFVELFGADLVQEANRLRAERPGLPASAVLVHWRGAEPASMTRVVHHPLGVEAPIALVAGRHSECDLGAIPGASLRHALVLLWPPAVAGEPPFAEAIDLGTQTGIALPDGELAARVAGSTALRFGVASADVVIVHARAGEPLPLDPATLPELLREAAGRDEHVSRVHALVLDRGGHRWLFDTASTNGTAVVDVDTGVATGPVRGKRTFALGAGQAPSLAGQVALLDVGVPGAPS